MCECVCVLYLFARTIITSDHMAFPTETKPGGSAAANAKEQQQPQQQQQRRGSPSSDHRKRYSEIGARLTLPALSRRKWPVFVSAGTPSSPSSMSLVRLLIGLVQEVAACDKPRVCQRRNAANIQRRIKLLSPLFEELKEQRPPLPPSAVLAFRELHVILQRVKLLLDDCRDGSCMFLLVENEAVSKDFHDYTQHIAAALEAVPLELLDLSDEVREQIELVRAQVRRAKMWIDPQDEQVRLEVLELLKQVERKEAPHTARLQALFNRLRLTGTRDCEREMQLLEEEMASQLSSSKEVAAFVNSLISFVRFGKCVLYGVAEVQDEDDEDEEEEDVEEDQVQASAQQQQQHTDYRERRRQRQRRRQRSDASSQEEVSTSGQDMLVNPPDEYRCPISLDLMRDPVIVATGQTYDRASIGRWLDAGNSTCPKTGQKLIHVSLIPNYALRSLISQWCEDHHVPFDNLDKDSRHAGVDHIETTKAALEATKMTAAFLVGKLATGSPEVQKQVAYELRLLAKCGMDNRMCIAEAGAIPFLVPLLASKDSKTQENAVTALLNLSIYENNKKLIMAADALDPILDVLKNGITMESRENAAATLFSLSVVHEYKITIGNRPQAIPSLVDLLREGTTRGKKDAATALFNLSFYHGNKLKVVAAGGIPILVDLLTDERAGLTDDVLAVLAILAVSVEGLTAIAQTGAIPVLVNLLRFGSAKGKENSIAVLLALCRNGGDDVIQRVFKMTTAIPSLYTLLTNGTLRAKRKASSLLKILHRWEPSAVNAAAVHGHLREVAASHGHVRVEGTAPQVTSRPPVTSAAHPNQRDPVFTAQQNNLHELNLTSRFSNMVVSV